MVLLMKLPCWWACFSDDGAREIDEESWDGEICVKWIIGFDEEEKQTIVMISAQSYIKT